MFWSKSQSGATLVSKEKTTTQPTRNKSPEKNETQNDLIEIILNEYRSNHGSPSIRKIISIYKNQFIDYDEEDESYDRLDDLYHKFLSGVPFTEDELKFIIDMMGSEDENTARYVKNIFLLLLDKKVTHDMELTDTDILFMLAIAFGEYEDEDLKNMLYGSLH